MSHLVSRQPWGVIDLDTDAGRVFFQQDWRYHWTVEPHAAPWTSDQRRRFHNRLDRQIWRRWSNRVRLRVAGATPFCRRFAARGVPINFDVRWVLSGGHWTVNVRKMPPGSGPTTFVSNVDFHARVINLDSADLATYAATNAAGVANPNFTAPPHEFGHTLANPDEYDAGDPHLADSGSIMNIGNRVRGRHLHLIVLALNALTPGCVWAAP
jgi:hypothetical protein